MSHRQEKQGWLCSRAAAIDGSHAGVLMIEVAKVLHGLLWRGGWHWEYGEYSGTLPYYNIYTVELQSC